MAGPDLSFATQLFNDLMDDECMITRSGDISDATYDEETRQLTAPAATVYRGPCLIGNLDTDLEVVANADVNTSSYEVEIPLSVVDIRKDDIVRVLSSRRDQDMVGLKLRVVSVVYETFAISRSLRCEVDR